MMLWAKVVLIRAGGFSSRVADTSPCSSGGTLKESSKRAVAARGPRKLAARVGAFDTNPSKAGGD